MIYYLDFGSFRYPTPLHKEYRERYGNGFQTIRNHVFRGKNYLLTRIKTTWLIKETRTSLHPSIQGDLMRLSEEAFESIINFYYIDIPKKEDLVLKSITLNNTKVYYICIKKEAIIGMSYYHSNMLDNIKLQGWDFDFVKNSNYDKNISIYEN